MDNCEECNDSGVVKKGKKTNFCKCIITETCSTCMWNNNTKVACEDCLPDYKNYKKIP